ncbi:Yae1 N domain-containing protein [Citrus sinensis]|nr:Yae1 N domain-containing protein [Citrus sinensis]KAH9745509.1 Yae1 N domain-containing protein [Citrus sinensis]
MVMMDLYSGGSNEEFDRETNLDREWQRRRDQFHTIWKEASAQEGFNIGFKESFHSGYNWGLVRGVTSALVCLLNELKEMLIEIQEKRNKFQNLHEYMHSLSTTDALKLFHDDILTEKAAEQSEHAEAGSNVMGLQNQSSDRSCLENHFGELESIILETPAIQVPLGVQK